MSRSDAVKWTQAAVRHRRDAHLSAKSGRDGCRRVAGRRSVRLRCRIREQKSGSLISFVGMLTARPGVRSLPD